MIQRQVPAGRGKASAENWRVKEFKRRAEEKKEREKNAYLIKPTPDRPPLAAVMLIFLSILTNFSLAPDALVGAPMGFTGGSASF